MSRGLVVVESPAKARTLKKFLGKDFEVLASYGHVRDLVPKEGAVDPDNDFEMHYQVIERNQKHVQAIAKALKNADELLLATDPDREGEAIAWHLVELLRERNLLDSKPVRRVVFHEITRRAIREAVASPKELSEDLVSAQQARRALDYLVGFNLSPLLWKKIRRGLSAGRVQSPALRMIVEREEEIERFEPREFWTIEAELEKDGKRFAARLTGYDGGKVEQFSFTDEQTARAAVTSIEREAGGELEAVSVQKKQRRRNPAAPFTTSTLQQEASRKLGFGAQRTMRIAQRLYEGTDTEGEGGFISYMRTDSVTLANEALDHIRQVIGERYGAGELPDRPRVYRTKAKNAQEAHEAIRPTDPARSPESLRGKLDSDQHRLYELIWKRTIACQMAPAVYDTVAVEFAAGPHRLRANGSILVKPGFLAVYQEGRDDTPGDDDADRILPEIAQGDRCPMLGIDAEQHFTEPPPRFTEASLVKTLEEYGIGRPSTYASIISTLLNREYAELERKRFTPTDVGRIVNRFLTGHFTRYVDYGFTARMEDALDAISRGEEDWLPLMRQFWTQFDKLVREKEATVTREEAAQARELGTDPKSGRPMSVRMGRYGPFVQIGTKDDEEKPRFAGLRPGQKMDAITREEALELFKLPRDLGETPEGEPLSVNIGRFGPYVRYGNKFASIKDDDPYTIGRERALELVAEKKQADANRLIKDFEDEGIQILRGRYGPYVTDKSRNAKVPKDREPASLTLAECQELLANAPARGRGRRGAKKGKTKAAAGAAAPLKAAAARKKPPTRKKTASRKKKSSAAGAKKKPGKKTAKKKTSKKKTSAAARSGSGTSAPAGRSD